MKIKMVLVYAFAVVLLLGLANRVNAQTFIHAQEKAHDGATQAESVLSIAAHVSEAFSYQGVLEEDGVPVTGLHDMSFSLYADDSCTTFVTGIVEIGDVPFVNGLFNVQLDFDHSVFTGQVLYLEVEVEGTAIACQEILPVPYALSLRPGAKVVTESIDSNVAAVTGEVSSTTPGSYSAGLRGINNGTGGMGIGVFGSQDGYGWGVFGQVDGDGRGVYGKADGPTGVGVYAEGSGFTGTALMLNDGGIRVNMAGLSTSTPVFIHQATVGNIACGFSQCTVIDHPLTNNDPNAILIVSQNFNPDTFTGSVNNPHPVGVQYLSASSRWAIYNVDLAAINAGAAFNVLVVKP